MNRCEDRKKLQRLLKQRKDVEAQIRALTFSDNRKSYRQLLQIAIERALSVKYPGAQSYTYYNEYNRIKASLHKQIGVNSKMLTRDEYLASLGILADMGYYVSEEEANKNSRGSITMDTPLRKGDFNIPGRVYNLLARHIGRDALTPKYILSLTEDSMHDINLAGEKTWSDIRQIQSSIELYFL